MVLSYNINTRRTVGFKELKVTKLIVYHILFIIPSGSIAETNTSTMAKDKRAKINQ